MLRITKTESGMVQGLPGADVRNTVFRGIPFAADTSGENRWRPPQPPKSWEGVRPCFEFAPITMQKVPGKDPNAFYSKEWHVEPEVPMSEDGSLCLNIWTPAKTGKEKMPVMVWIFGGGLQEGYCHEMEFDGESFNRRGVILVTIAYRVNVFGFLAHPELTAENPEAPTNFGLLDQKAGIEWVKRNIENFGGDSENITIFGQSAGGGSTLYHCTSPQTKGLFQKAIAESAGGVKMVDPDIFLPMAMDLEAAEAMGEKFVREVLGCSSLAEARKLDAQLIEDKYIESGLSMQAVIDDKYILGQSYDRVLADEINDIILMFGNTTGEFMAKPGDDVEGWAKKMFAKETDAEEYLAICRAAAGDDPVQLKKEASICSFDITAKMSATVMAKHGRKYYYYVFGPTIPGDNAGAFHSCDLWFEFETLMKCWRPFDGHHYDIARKMCTYWANFAKTGDPNGDDADGIPLPQWRPFTLEDPCTMYFMDQVYSDNKPFSGKTKYLVEKNLAKYEY
ncbi:MAG: carboxylesterase family protein [Oscillospiraceae bacterium]|nr:carboxylesterase family protein [Oscillospiraceae bacterium]